MGLNCPEVQQQNTTWVEMGKAVPPSHTPIDNTAAAVAERWWLLVERWNSLLENIPILLPRTPRKPGTLHWCLAHKLKQQWETHPWPEVAGMWASPGRTLAHGHTISPSHHLPRRATSIFLKELGSRTKTVHTKWAQLSQALLFHPLHEVRLVVMIIWLFS